MRNETSQQRNSLKVLPRAKSGVEAAKALTTSDTDYESR